MRLTGRHRESAPDQTFILLQQRKSELLLSAGRDIRQFDTNLQSLCRKSTPALSENTDSLYCHWPTYINFYLNYYSSSSGEQIGLYSLYY